MLDVEALRRPTFLVVGYILDICRLSPHYSIRIPYAACRREKVFVEPGNQVTGQRKNRISGN